MSTAVAIEIANDFATVVCAETLAEGRVQLLEVRRMPLPELALEAEPGPRPPDLEDQLGREIDASLAVLNTSHVLYTPLELPFIERRKVEQVAPLQVQDLLPFNLDEFVLDNLLLEQQAGGGKFIASLAGREDVKKALRACRQLGTDPKMISSIGTAIAGLPLLLKDALPANAALLYARQSRLALAVFVERKLCHLREWTITETEPALEQLATDLRCSLAEVVQRKGQALEGVYLIDLPRRLDPLREQLRIPVRFLDLNSLVERAPNITDSTNSLAWAIGLFAGQIALQRKTRPQLADFRRGDLAYKPGLRFLFTALRDELFYIVLSILLGLTWILTSFLSTQFALSRLENSMQQELAQNFPGEAVPARGEVDFLDTRIGEIENRLRELGSLSALSPLESLKELSAAIRSDLSLDIDNMSIGQSRISFQGSVADFPSVGRLSSVLESQAARFCKVLVDAKGKMPGSNRVRYVAELELCE